MKRILSVLLSICMVLVAQAQDIRTRSRRTGSPIAGAVLDQEGRPIQGATVALVDRVTRRVVGTGVTNADGSYSFSDPGGDIDIRVSYGSQVALRSLDNASFIYLKAARRAIQRAGEGIPTEVELLPQGVNRNYSLSMHPLRDEWLVWAYAKGTLEVRMFDDSLRMVRTKTVAMPVEDRNVREWQPLGAFASDTAYTILLRAWDYLKLDYRYAYCSYNLRNDSLLIPKQIPLPASLLALRMIQWSGRQVLLCRYAHTRNALYAIDLTQPQTPVIHLLMQRKLATPATDLPAFLETFLTTLEKSSLAECRRSGPITPDLSVYPAKVYSDQTDTLTLTVTDNEATTVCRWVMKANWATVRRVRHQLPAKTPPAQWLTSNGLVWTSSRGPLIIRQNEGSDPSAAALPVMAKDVRYGFGLLQGRMYISGIEALSAPVEESGKLVDQSDDDGAFGLVVGGGLSYLRTNAKPSEASRSALNELSDDGWHMLPYRQTWQQTWVDAAAPAESFQRHLFMHWSSENLADDLPIVWHRDDRIIIGILRPKTNRLRVYVYPAK